MQGVTSIEDAESFMLKHGENIVDILGGEVDRIEKNLKVLQWQQQAYFIISSYCIISYKYKYNADLYSAISRKRIGGAW